MVEGRGGIVAAACGVVHPWVGLVYEVVCVEEVVEESLHAVDGQQAWSGWGKRVERFEGLWRDWWGWLFLRLDPLVSIPS